MTIQPDTLRISAMGVGCIYVPLAPGGLLSRLALKVLWNEYEKPLTGS